MYVLRPNQSLQNTVEEQMARKAKALMAQTAHTMALEEQGVSDPERQAQYERLLTKLRQGSPRRLWDDL